MSRKRYVYREVEPGQVEAIEIDLDTPLAERRAPVATEELVYGKAQTTDGEDISSRRRMREYMKREGVAHASDYGPGYMEKKQAERAKAFTPGSGYDRERRRAALVDSMKRLDSQRKRKS